MMDIDEIEKSRLQTQIQLDFKKTRLERNRAGQFATPTALALDMLNYAKLLLSPEIAIQFLDPAIGTGVFIAALYRSFLQRQITKIVGFEIDPLFANAASNLWGNTSLQINSADFTKAEPPNNKDDRFNLVVCNPPYVRHHHLQKEEKHRLRKAAEEASGIRVSEQSGLYCHFLWLSHQWLAENGLAGWLIPSEFMNTNYGQQVRDYLLSRVTLLRVHCFMPTDVQFSDALVSSSIIWFKKSLPSGNQAIDFSYGGTLAKPELIKTVSPDLLRQVRKWNLLSIIGSAQTPTKQKSDPTLITPPTAEKSLSAPAGNLQPETHIKGYKLADLFDIKRGLATGANDFFILNHKQVVEHQIPEEFLRPVLPSSRYILADEVEADDKGNPILENPLFLLVCDLPENEIKNNYPFLWEYLQLGVKREINKTYLCSHRTPWYSQEKRSVPLFVYSYMGRQKSANSSPYRFLLNHSKAVATNSYHVLYPKKSLQSAIIGDAGVLHKLWEKLQNLATENLLIEGRTYGGGLHKMEPGELANVLIEDLPEVLLRTIHGPHSAQNLWQIPSTPR
ncbi:MAG TPA: N-6 DNA methylase [Ktedonobacteraceae bacterium]